MSDFITLTCPSCGGKLQVTNEIERFACGYCGKEHLVRRGGGIISLAPVVEGINKVEAGVNRVGDELAIARLEREIAESQSQQKESHIPPMWTARLLVYGVGLFILVYLSSSSMGLGCTIGAIVLGALLLLASVGGPLGAAQRRKEIQRTIDEKRAEIAKHQQGLS